MQFLYICSQKHKAPDKNTYAEIERAPDEDTFAEIERAPVDSDNDESCGGDGFEVDKAKIVAMVRRARQRNFTPEEVEEVQNFNQVSVAQRSSLLWKLWPTLAKEALVPKGVADTAECSSLAI